MKNVPQKKPDKMAANVHQDQATGHVMSVTSAYVLGKCVHSFKILRFTLKAKIFINF